MQTLFFFIPLQLGEGVCVCTHVHTSVPTLTYIHAIAYDLLRGIHLEKNRKDFNTASLQVPARAWGYEDANLKGQGHPFFALPLPPEGEERPARRKGLFPAGRRSAEENNRRTRGYGIPDAGVRHD